MIKKSIFALMVIVLSLQFSPVTGQTLFNKNAEYPRFTTRFNTGTINHVSSKLNQMLYWRKKIVAGFGFDIAVSNKVKIGFNVDLLDQAHSKDKYNTLSGETVKNIFELQYLWTYGFQITYYPGGFSNKIFQPYFIGGLSRTRFTFSRDITTYVGRDENNLLGYIERRDFHKTSNLEYFTGYLYGLGIEFAPKNWMSPFIEFRWCSSVSNIYEGNIIFIIGLKNHIF